MGLGSGILGSIINYMIVIFVLLLFIFIIYTKIQDYKKGKNIFNNSNRNEKEVENAEFKRIK